MFSFAIIHFRKPVAIIHPNTNKVWWSNFILHHRCYRTMQKNASTSSPVWRKTSHSFTPKASFSITSMNQIKNVTVIGAGLMGSGIAQVSAQAGFHVTLTDTQPSMLEKSTQALQRAFAKWSEQQASKPPALPTVHHTADVAEAVRQADMVIEAVVERVAEKQAVFAQVDRHAPPHTLLVSNTSSIPIHELARAVGVSRQRWVAGMHFFNPVTHMPLVELIVAAASDPLVLPILTAFCKAVGKVPVVCKDTPGFIVNRLLVPYMMEAVRLAERGDASIQDIDTAMKLGAGYPMGPFELADFVGLDTLQSIVRGWYEQGEKGLKGNALVKPSEYLDQLVQQGKLGRKSGAGFYDYTKKTKL